MNSSATVTSHCTARSDEACTSGTTFTETPAATSNSAGAGTRTRAVIRFDSSATTPTPAISSGTHAEP